MKRHQGAEAAIPASLDRRIFFLAFFAVLHFANTFADLFNRPPTTVLFVDREATSPLYTYLYALIHVVALTCLLPVWRKAFEVLRSNVWILLLLALAFGSTLWSLEPAISFKRAVAMLGSLSLILCLTIYVPPRAFLRMLTWMSLIFVFSAPLMVVLLPAYGKGTGTYADAWRGITAHKNGLGWMMVIAVFTLIYAYRLKQISHRLLLVSLPVAFVCLLMSKSTTSYLALVVGLGVMLTLDVMRRIPGQRLFLGLFIVACASAAALLADTIIQAVLVAVQKDPTLTGRTVIWARLLEAIQHRPVLGYGYRAFWESNYAVELMTISGFFAGHSHNGYVDMLLDLGGLGLAVYLCAALMAIAKLFAAAMQRNEYAACQLVIMLVIMFIGASGPVVLRPNTIYFILTCMPIVYASRLSPKPLPKRSEAEAPGVYQSA